MRPIFDLRVSGNGVAALFLALTILLTAGPVRAAVTAIRMESDPLDPIGMGSSYDLAPADGVFSLSGDAGAIQMSFQPNGPGDPWTFSFAAPSGDVLASGVPFSPVSPVSQAQSPSGLPTMSVAGGGRSCGWVSGAFDVRQLTLDADGRPTSMWVTFEQHCAGDVPALRGDLRVNADVPVDIRAPFAQFANPGETIVFFAVATDEGGGWVSFTADGVPPGAFFMDFFDNSAVFVWTPTASDIGTHRVTFHGDNGQGGFGETETVLRVGPPSLPPVASAGGPYEGMSGSAIVFDGSASFDPDSAPLRYFWDFGDGAMGRSPGPAHAYASGGVYTVRLIVCDEDRCSMDETSINVIDAMLPARAFLDPDDKVIRLGTGRPYIFVRLESDAGAFALESVVLSSLVLRSEGTGSVASVGCVPGRTAISRDSDKNKLEEINAAFSIPELRSLFADLDGEQDVPVTVEGYLDDGTPFRAELMVTVISDPGNSLNAKLTQKRGRGLSLALAQSASVTLRVFDVTGRLVTEVLSGRTLSAGEHEVDFTTGSGIRPGIYFYRMQVGGELSTGRLYVAR